jgi:hypothetical protein
VGWLASAPISRSSGVDRKAKIKKEGRRCFLCGFLARRPRPRRSEASCKDLLVSFVSLADGGQTDGGSQRVLRTSRAESRTERLCLTVSERVPCFRFHRYPRAWTRTLYPDKRLRVSLTSVGSIVDNAVEQSPDERIRLRGDGQKLPSAAIRIRAELFPVRLAQEFQCK